MMLKHFAPTTDPVVSEYVEKIAYRLENALPGTRRIAVVVDQSGEEPPVLPDGTVVISERSILTAQDEAEFAGIVAHAMAHAALKRFSFPVIPLNGFENSPAYAPMKAMQRQVEIDADRRAVRAMIQSGFDPSAFVRYVARTQPDAARLDEMRWELSLWQPREYTQSGEFASIQKRLRAN